MEKFVKIKLPKKISSNEAKKKIEKIFNSKFKNYKKYLKIFTEIDYIDLYNHNFKEDHFYDGVHTTHLGSIEIGEQIAAFIISDLKTIKNK